MKRSDFFKASDNNIKVARKLLKIAKSLIADGEGNLNEKEDAKEMGFDKRELEKIVNDVEKAGDKVEDVAEKSEDMIEDALDEQNGANASIYQMNQLYASQYSKTNITADTVYYKANVLAEECRLAAIKVAKYLRAKNELVAKTRVAGFSEGFAETHRSTVEKIKNAIKKTLKYFSDRINAFINYVKVVCQNAKEAGKEKLGFLARASLTAAVVAIIALFGPVVLAVYGIVKAFDIAKNEIENAFKSLYESFQALKKAIAGKIDDILTAVGKVAGVVVALPVAIYELVEEAFSNPAEAAK